MIIFINNIYMYHIYFVLSHLLLWFFTYLFPNQLGGVYHHRKACWRQKKVFGPKIHAAPKVIDIQVNADHVAPCLCWPWSWRGGGEGGRPFTLSWYQTSGVHMEDDRNSLVTRCWFHIFFDFHPEPWGRWTQFDEYFSDGLVQPPTRLATWFRTNLWGLKKTYL